MRSARTFATAFALALSLTATGCFRVSSETRALRDAALESGFEDAEEKIEIGVGFFTVTLAKLATKYIELPPEARTALRSLRNAECAVYEVQSARGSLSSVLAEADRVMEDRGWERLVGVIQSDQLVAVYVPKDLA